MRAKKKEKRGWFLHTGDYPPGWEKKVKVINLPAPSEKEIGRAHV